jgi:hypothetical protein
MRNAYKILVIKPKGKKNFGNLAIEKRVIIIQIFLTM